MYFGVQRIDHVEVLVRDIEAAARWYRQVLGLEELRRWHPEPVMIGAGDTTLALFQAWPDAASADDDRRYDRIRWQRVAWRVDRAGLEAAQEHLTSLGVDFRGPVDHGTSLSIYFHDPDGNPLEITCQGTDGA
jgi:catechol 2,3-dioxygenase-like lactoylglutathione lyase family enzyme